MKPRYTKRIRKDDFPTDVQKWIDILLYPLNAGISETSQILEKNISLYDNIAAEVKTLRIDGCSKITADSVIGSNTVTNAVYYSATIDGITYGPSAGQSFWGFGFPPGTTISSVSGSTIVLSQTSSITQSNANYLCGGFFPLTIAQTLSFRPSSVIISNITDLQGNPTYIAEGVTPQWRFDRNNIIIDGISGLQAGRAYNITFIIL